jgi:GT2 family glycosyltransferase
MKDGAQTARWTAVVPTLGAATLGAALRALAEQVPKPHLLVVAQGPVDLAGAPVDQRLDLDHAVGFAAAVNRGLHAARTPFVATVNDDAVVEPGWAAALLEAFESRDRLAAAQGVNTLTSGRLDGVGVAWNRDWQAVQVRHGEDVATRGASAASAESPAPTESFGVAATAALYRRSALEHVATSRGVFDERLETFYEDVDLAVRLAGGGWQAALVPAARACHVGSLTTAREPRKRWRLLTRNRRLVLARLLGRDLAAELPRIVRRDRRDFLRATAHVDAARALGILDGMTAAGELLKEFAHDGPPLVDRDTLAGYGAPPRRPR